MVNWERTRDCIGVGNSWEKFVSHNSNNTCNKISVTTHLYRWRSAERHLYRWVGKHYIRNKHSTSDGSRQKIPHDRKSPGRMDGMVKGLRHFKHANSGCIVPEYFNWLIEQCFTSPPTQYRLYGRRFLQVKRPNQQYQSNEGESWKENNPKNIKKTENTHTHTRTHAHTHTHTKVYK